uniref:E1 domain-containing protein n=1 Tax=Romanomermis culicivorax TaxID=13658 RepID=A0A915KYI8_ROMCU
MPELVPDLKNARLMPDRSKQCQIWHRKCQYGNTGGKKTVALPRGPDSTYSKKNQIEFSLANPFIFAVDPSPPSTNSRQNTAIIFGDHLNNVRNPLKNNHELHAPEVAFHCGYKNKYVDQSTGKWLSDKAIYATCLAGKLDILKYCRKVYPHLQITNIVEAENQLTISDWCKAPEGSTCKWSFLSRPFKCLVGEFESEALLVPQGCHFGHVDDRSECKDFDYWNRTAQLECSKRLGDLYVESFSMLEPCGLDMFSGVEYVCCPKNSPSNVEMNANWLQELKTLQANPNFNKLNLKTTKNLDDFFRQKNADDVLIVFQMEKVIFTKAENSKRPHNDFVKIM